MPYCDYIFGNETEAATYAEHHGLSADTPIEEIAKHISKLDKINKSRPRTVVFTQVSFSRNSLDIAQTVLLRNF